MFLTAEALATLLGSVAGPALATGLSLSATAVAACALSTVGALVGLVVVPVDPELVASPGPHSRTT